LNDLIDNEEQNHTFSILVENEAGVLARVIGLLSGRGYNIERLTVAEVDKDEFLSKITIVSSGTQAVHKQIRAQLERLVPVRTVEDLTNDGPSIERELALVKVSGNDKLRAESLKVANTFCAKVADKTDKSYVFEVVDSTDKLDIFISLMKPLGLVDVSRTGVVAISRGSKPI
jgi:acetolactate synthase-1/3 small subunit